MRIVMFCHSLVSDWHHGHAHFLRGIVTELLARGHAVQVYEPLGGWSRSNLEHDHPDAVQAFADAYPMLSSTTYDLATLDPGTALRGAELVIVHEWNEPELIARIGAHQGREGGCVLLFHDTHHRSITDPGSLAELDLRHYDGVLACGDAVARMYVERGWVRAAWTWHAAADVRVFHPRSSVNPRTAIEPAPPATACADASRGDGDQDDALWLDRQHDGDLVWIGNFGEDERTVEMDEFLLAPVRRLGLRAAVYGVRYPDDVLARLASAGIEYRGWLPNHQVPEIFAQYKMTLHIPRRPYVTSLPGIPTIRPFEAMACGIPFVSARWHDAGGLFTPGDDFLVADDGDEMTAHLAALLRDPRLRDRIAGHALHVIQARHTCTHRVDELLRIHEQVRAGREATMMGAEAVRM